MKRPMKIKCRSCGSLLPERIPGETAFFPFCSKRCRDVDLGNWFEEKYRIPLKSGERDDDQREEGPE